jgi:hypothetical protein
MPCNGSCVDARIGCTGAHGAIDRLPHDRWFSDRKDGLRRRVTLIQRFGTALYLNVHWHMLLSHGRLRLLREIATEPVTLSASALVLARDPAAVPPGAKVVGTESITGCHADAGGFPSE